MSLFDPQRWGLPNDAIDNLADRLRGFCSRFKDCFKTKTHHTSEYGWVYLRGILTMDSDRNYANIARRVIAPDDDGQNLQHFMTDSPWKAEDVFTQIQQEIKERPELSDGMLTLDESGRERAGDQSAGAARQYLGRFGKVDMGQVGVGLGYYKNGLWTMVDAELYLPEKWFNDEHKELWKGLHIPDDLTFTTKIQMGLEMIQKAQKNGLPFSMVSADSLYGRDSAFRASLDTDGIKYVLDIPKDYLVYATRPITGVPETPAGKKGRPFSRWRVLNGVEPVEVQALLEEVVLQKVQIRHTERGLLVYDGAAQKVWTITDDGTVRSEWLLFWRGPSDNTVYFTLSNASFETPWQSLLKERALRYFAERVFQDAKSEAGWDELVARKYLSF
jgi:SRSO17 transposase